MILTARNIQVACLFIKRKESKIHGTEQGKGDPDAVEDVTVRKHSDVQVGSQNVVK